MRRPFQGLAAVVAFNWPFYLAAAITVGLWALLWREFSAVALWLTPVAVGAIYLSVASLVVSHWVYDRSALYRLTWLDQLPASPRRAASIHAGYDESATLLRQRLPEMQLQTFDFFDATRNTERSIQRARNSAGRDDAAKPLSDGLPPALDTIFVILSAHEMRREAERTALFARLREALRPGGQIVVIEHLRDLANLLAYGPGFLHFHSETSWRRSFAAAGLAVKKRFAITPFVAGFVLQ